MSCLGADLVAAYHCLGYERGDEPGNQVCEFVSCLSACLVAWLLDCLIACLLYGISTVVLPARSRREKACRSLAGIRTPWFAITWHRGAERCFEMSLHPFAGISDLANGGLRSSCTPHGMFLRGRKYY